MLQDPLHGFTVIRAIGCHRVSLRRLVTAGAGLLLAAILAVLAAILLDIATRLPSPIWLTTGTLSLRTDALALLSALPLILTRPLFAATLTAACGLVGIATALAISGSALLLCSLLATIGLLPGGIALLLLPWLSLLLIPLLSLRAPALIVAGLIIPIRTLRVLILRRLLAASPWFSIPISTGCPVLRAVLRIRTRLPLAVAIILPSARRRRHLRLPWRCGSVDPQRLPGGRGEVRLFGPRVCRNGAVLQHRARAGPEPFRHNLDRSLENARLLFGQKHDLAGHIGCPLKPGLDRNTGETEIGIDGPHPDQDRCRRRHPQGRLARFLDRHLGADVGDDLDPMLERIDDLDRLARGRGCLGLELESV